MANPSAPTWEESEEVKVPTWAESKEIDAPSWEDSEPYVEPVGTMPKSQFGADIPMPLDVTGVGTPDITPEPTQFRTITDPAALRRRQAEESTWQSLSAGEKLQSDLASTARGGVETAADIVQGAGVAGTKMPATPISSPFGFMTAPGINEAIAKQRKQLAMTPEERRAAVDANPIFQAGKTLREAGEKSFPTIQPESVDRPLADLGQGVASTVAFLPGALAGPGGVAVLGALAGGAGAYNEARQAGADEDKAENAFWINALAGTSEAVPLSRIFKRLDHASGREFTKSLMEMLKSGLEEGTQEVFQTVMSNIAAEHLYDKDREFLDGIVKGGGVGFFTGLLLSSLGVRGGKQAVRDVRGHFNPAIKVANLLDESALQGSPAQTAQTEIHAATDRPEEEQFVKTDFEKPTPEPTSSETKEPETAPNKPPITTETSAPPELPKIRKGYRAIKIQLPDGTVIDGITNDKTWEIKGKEVVNVGRPVELNGKIKWSDGPLREGEKIVEPEPEESQMDYGEGGEMPATPGTSFPVPETKVETPSAAAAKVEEEVDIVIKTKGSKDAKEVKRQLVEEVEKLLGKTEQYSDKGRPVTIEIPGDGTFKVPNSWRELTELLARAKRIKTNSTPEERRSVFTNPKPTGNFDPDIWVESSEPTHEVTIYTTETVPGKVVNGVKEPETKKVILLKRKGRPVTIPGHEDKTLFITSDGESFTITEPRTGMAIGKGDKISDAIEDAKAKLKTIKLSWEKSIAKGIAVSGEIPAPTPIDRTAKPKAKEKKAKATKAKKGGEQLQQTQTKATSPDATFDRAFAGEEEAFDELDELLRGVETDAPLFRFGRGDPNTVRTAAAFEKLFEDAFKARDFDKILDAIKATSDVSIWKPLLQKFFKEQKTGDKIAALKADWMRAVFNGTRPKDALPPKAPKPPPKASTTPPRPAQPPPGPPPAPPPRRIDPTGITTGPLKSPYRIIKDFSRSIKHALRVRRQRFGVLGTYHPGSTLTTLRFAGDLDTAAHELAGHWTDDRYGIGRPWMNQRGPSPYDTELQKFWIHGSYRPTMPRRLARAEGIAEYIRAYVVNPDAARLAAPNFTVYFEGSIPAPALKAIKDFSNDVRRWYGANPLEQGRLNFRMNPPGLTEKLWDVLRGEGYGFFITPIDRLRQAFDDSLHYSMKGYRAAKKIQGKNLNPEHDFEIIARLLPSHDARFSDQLEHGLIDYRARQIMRSDGKLEVSRPHDPVTNQPMSLPWLLGNFDRSSSKAFETEMLDTSAYMVHQRALEKAQQLGRTDNITGMAAGMYPGGDVEVANRFFREVANDPAYRAKLAENARRYRLWADHNLQMLLDAGRITPAQFNRIKANNTQYVTMNRLSEEFDIKHGGKSSRAVGTAKQPLDRFKGSSLEINNVYSNLLEQTDAVQKEAFRNGAMQAYVESLVHNRRLNEPDRKNLQEFGHISNSTEPHTIKVYRNGKVENWKFDKDIYENLKGLTELGIQVPWLLRSIPMFSRYMITHAPSFLLRNPVRDTFQRAVVSNNGSKPWDILRGYSQADLSRMNIFGGGQFGNYIIDKHVWNRELNRVARELVKDPRNILFSPLKLKHAWEELAKKSESVGRIGEFRRAFDVGKSRGYDDYNAALYASAEARGLLDFAKAGTAMRVINQLIPFSNARIRGLARSAFQIKEHPGRFALNWGLMVLAPTLLTMLWNRKDKETWEEYQQLPAYRKDFFWNFKVGHHWIIIPRPHELGVMAGGVERAINRMLGDKRALEGYGQSIGSAYLPVQDPVEATGPLRTGLELYFNRDSFRGHDIVPGWEKDLNLNLREGTKHASTIGQNLGKILQSTGIGADPRQVDYFLNSLGGWGQMATTVTSPTRTMGEFAAKSTGFSTDVPSSGARDVQWDLNFAKENGLTQRDEIKKLKKLREDVLNEKDPAIRDRKAKVLRDYATALRTGLEKMGPLKQKLPAKVR